MSGGVVIDWGVETPERKALLQKEQNRLTQALAAMGAHLVVLFGSRARGDSRAGSDLDLLVVMDCDRSFTFARRLAEVGAHLDPRVATDLLVYLPEEFERLRHESVFVKRALTEGLVLHRCEGPEARAGEGS